MMPDATMESWHGRQKPFLVTDTGWLALTTFSEDDSAGTKSWNYPENAKTENAAIGGPPLSETVAYSATAVGGTGTTKYLKGLKLEGCDIPDDATILGVEMRIKKAETGINETPAIEDEEVRLVVGGTIQGANYWLPADFSQVAYTWSEYGGPADLWNLGRAILTPAAIKADDFGFAYSFIVITNFTTGAIDCVQIKVHYALQRQP